MYTTFFQISVCEVPGGNFVALYASDTMTLSVKLYSNGLVTATVEYYTDQVNEHKIANDVSLLLRCFNLSLSHAMGVGL